jgi:hypothetical protein
MMAGKLDQAVFVELLGLERRVRGAEVDGARRDLLDAAARADRLIVEADAGRLAVRVRPLGVDGIREGGASASDACGKHRSGNQGKQCKQDFSPHLVLQGWRVVGYGRFIAVL